MLDLLHFLNYKPKWYWDSIELEKYVISTTDTFTVSGIVHTLGSYKECADAFSYVAAHFFTPPEPPKPPSPIIYKGSILEGWRPETVMSSFEKQYGITITAYIAKEEKEAKERKIIKD